MQTIIGVRFKKAGKIYYFGPGNLEIEPGQHVIVETARGMECGLTVLGPREVEDHEITQPLKIVHRIANASDLQRIEENKKRQVEAFAICEKKIQEHKLPMKLVEVEYTFDMNKIIFYFTADGRIDFRNLVKDLAAVFRTRIELRQIGVRDEAKLMGGIGCCGRPLCCASFLGDFEPVSIRMAKEQNLSLNPTKISGICGRLMCCLKYENDCYCENCHKKQKKVMAPAQGSRVVSVEGEGKVISLNQQRRTATILLDNSRTIVASWEDVIEKDEDDIDTAAAIPAEPVVDEVLAGMEAEETRQERPRRERSRRPRGERKQDGHSRDKRESRDKEKETRNAGSHGRRRPRGDHEKSREGGNNRPRRDRRPRGNREKNGNNGGGKENKE
ncbi:Cell fate regulator YaaT, PSP1 superfamily (controls sporulation, competence, biofilm development) [Selenomonas sp. GACV-9]|uniref:PSP1 domain-containing protein n=1 Tax=Selenomonas sp. GACV-9 TaxID=3158782 RepID=UPI0008F05FBC|nr:Cell fate regulator YaaT, PSP1 superfamily (controls sporulation, competence, biofilm development) [Selenomonas ruminantium]